MNVDFQKVLQKAEEYRGDISKFLRDMIRIPSESCHERKIVERIQEEMQKLQFDKVHIDKFGNIIGTIGKGKHVIAIDAHIDTVGIGDLNLWQYDPYVGYEDLEKIIGRGSSCQKGGMAAMVYAGKIIKDLNLQGEYTLLITGTLQKEDCAGLSWQYMLNEDKLQPEFVVITEPTACNICIGHRGLVEVQIIIHGLTHNAVVPNTVEDSIYEITPIINDLDNLDKRLSHDEFLGSGTLTISEMFFKPSLGEAEGAYCTISISRILTNGETFEGALEQIKNLPSVKDIKAAVYICDYEKPSYRGVVYPTAAYFPAWLIEEEHVVYKTLVESYKGLFNKEPVVDKWTISTNGVSIMGRYGIPCIGFGPGHQSEAQSPNERTWKSELVNASAMYAVIPSLYVNKIV